MNIPCTAPSVLFCFFFLEETFKGSQQPSPLSLNTKACSRLAWSKTCLFCLRLRPLNTEHLENTPPSAQDLVTSDPNQFTSCWCDQRGVQACVSDVVTFWDVQTFSHREGFLLPNIPGKISLGFCCCCLFVFLLLGEFYSFLLVLCLQKILSVSFSFSKETCL